MSARPVASLLLFLALATGGSGVNAQGPVVTSLTLFAGTPSGLWRSKDWGRTWERVRGKSGDGIDSVGAVHTVSPMGPWVWVGGEQGTFFSEDFGETWSQRSSEGPVLALLPSRYPQADHTVFIGTPSGLLKSLYGGRKPEPTLVRGTPVYRLEWPGPALIVGTGRGVAVSMDSAARFEPAGTGFPEGDVRALALSSFYAVDPVLFAGVGSAGVHRSSDGGKTWGASGLAGRTATDLVWLGPHLYAVTDAGVFRSDDAGKSWSPLGGGLNGPRPLRLLFPLAPDAGNEVFLATSDGVYRSADGGRTWQLSGLKGETVHCVATFPAPSRTSGKRPKR